MPTPPKSGCFEAQYPSVVWQEVPCVKVQNTPLGAPGNSLVPSGSATQKAGGPSPLHVGGGVADFLANVGSDSITMAKGSFSRVTGVTSVTDWRLDGDSWYSHDNWYSLQMNTNNNFPVPEYCAGCTGWQQFAYRNGDTSSSYVWIENFLFGYGASCPSSAWAYHPEIGACILDSPGTYVPPQTLADLPKLVLKGQANAWTGTEYLDYAYFSAGNGKVYSMSQPASVLHLTNRWKTVEYNIFGWGGGSEARFLPNNSSTIIVNVDLWTLGQTFVPTCTGNGVTAEWNDLTLVSPCCPLAGNPFGDTPRPGITFAESNVAGASPAFCVTWDNVPILSLLR